MKSKNYFTAKRLAFLATFVAIVCVATFVIKIPSPSGQGYINVGDTLVFVCGVFFDPFFAFVASGLGSMLADLFGGYVAYAPFTFVVKGLEGFVCAIMLSLLKKIKAKPMVYAIAMFIAGLVMVGGYFVTDLLLFGLALAVANLPFSFIQLAANLVLGMMFALSLGKIDVIKNLLSLK